MSDQLVVNGTKISRAVVADEYGNLIHDLPIIPGEKKGENKNLEIQSSVRLAGLVNVLLKKSTGLSEIIPENGILILYNDKNVQVGKFQWKDVGKKRTIVKLQDHIFK